MKTTVMTLLAILCAACSAVATTTSSIIYSKEVVYSTPVHVVYVDLNDPDVRVTVAIARRGRGNSEPVASIIARTHPSAAITGTFFDTRTLIPTGDILICGTRIHSGCVGSSLCITRANRASIVSRKFRKEQDDINYETILQAGPTLVSDGRISLNLRAEGFRDPRLSRTTRKAALGITSHNKLILISTTGGVSPHGLAKIMQRLGATQAIMLDGGSSTAMYAGGRIVLHPARRLTNMLLVYKTSDSYRMAVGQLAPTLLSASTVTARVILPTREPGYPRLARVSDTPPVNTFLPSTGAPTAGTLPFIDTESTALQNWRKYHDNIK